MREEFLSSLKAELKKRGYPPKTDKELLPSRFADLDYEARFRALSFCSARGNRSLERDPFNNLLNGRLSVESVGQELQQFHT